MSKSEAAKVAGRLQKDGALDSWEPMAALFDQIRDRCLTVIRERDELQKLADKTALAAADRTLQAEHGGELGRVQELERQLQAAREEKTAAYETARELEQGLQAALERYDELDGQNARRYEELDAARAEIAELKAANEDLSDRNARQELERELKDARVAAVNAETEMNSMEQLLIGSYVAREVPWTDVAAGMMTIARDGTPWMVVGVGDGAWTLTGLHTQQIIRFEKKPEPGETVRVLVPYVTPEQAEALVASELGGTEVES